ncbi:MAG: putative toxin-antitoxin system toxin component, PIN family [Phycisphaerales bacterium]|nr:putative toxin-antitoxin system toxin component, PIN family [Phycisphaerales bacterium]
MSDTHRVVFDCNTLLQALASPDGAAGACVQMAFDRRVELFVSPTVIAELRDVAARPVVARKLRLKGDRVAAFIEAIESSAIVLEGFAELFVYERDPDDAHYVNLALAADATLIVTRDADLLDLMNASQDEGKEFQTRFPTLKIVTPPAFLAVIRRSEPRP